MQGSPAFTALISLLLIPFSPNQVPSFTILSLLPFASGKMISLACISHLNATSHYGFVDYYSLATVFSLG